MNRHELAMMALLCLPSIATANQGHGHLGVTGSIVDTACSIETGDLDQGIEMGTLPVSDLINGGHGPLIPFTVHLKNCDLDDGNSIAAHHWRDVRITFEGAPDGGNLFAMEGTARGEGVAIQDVTGAQAVPGRPMVAIPIVSGSMALHYRMQIEGDRRPLRPGNFTTALRYFMEYE